MAKVKIASNSFLLRSGYSFSLEVGHSFSREFFFTVPGVRGVSNWLRLHLFYYLFISWLFVWSAQVVWGGGNCLPSVVQCVWVCLCICAHPSEPLPGIWSSEKSPHGKDPGPKTIPRLRGRSEPPHEPPPVPSVQETFRSVDDTLSKDTRQGFVSFPRLLGCVWQTAE